MKREINNNIKESYCNLEVSKLLKSLGFESDESRMRFDSRGYYFLKNEYNFWSTKFVDSIERPTLSVTIDWLSENFGFWISVERDFYNNFFPKVDIISQESWDNEEFRDIRRQVNRELKKEWIKSHEEAVNKTLLLILQKLES